MEQTLQFQAVPTLVHVSSPDQMHLPSCKPEPSTGTSCHNLAALPSLLRAAHLLFIHSADLQHLSLKPSNIAVSKPGLCAPQNNELFANDIILNPRQTRVQPAASLLGVPLQISQFS